MSVIGIGTDLVDVSRIRAEIERNPAFIENVFSPAEIYAGRFAAKEAFYKALPVWVQNETSWLDVEILAGSNGEPKIRPSVNCNDSLRKLGVDTIFVSISHENELAIAFIVLSR